MGARVLELCAGAGGQASGLELAGFEHAGLIENDVDACKTLRVNRRHWNVIEHDLFDYKQLNLEAFRFVDLLAGGLPCPPFSVAGKQLGERDERNLFNVGVNLVEELQPKAVMFENVKGILEPRFSTYREWIDARLRKLGYVNHWKLINVSDFGVPQLRPRVLMVALRNEFAPGFEWPVDKVKPKTVGEALGELMARDGWEGAAEWARRANRIAPTLVGGSKKHGGPDLGPTRSRKAWAELGVDGIGLANAAPAPGFSGIPRITVEMAARLQGFADDWHFVGGKTSTYRQVGNAFPPPAAEMIGICILKAISKIDRGTNVAQG